MVTILKGKNWRSQFWGRKKWAIAILKGKKLANSEKTLIEALQEASTFTDMRIYLYKSATIARWRDFSEICDQFPMALGLCHRWHRRDTSKTARAWKPAVRRWTEPWVGGNQAKRKRASSSLSWPQSKSGLVLRWSLRSSLAILIQVSIITFLWPGITHLEIIPLSRISTNGCRFKKAFLAPFLTGVVRRP